MIIFLNEVLPEKAVQIAHLVDLKSLDKTSEGLWNNQPKELIDIIRSLAIGKDCEPARSWINQHSSEFESLNPLLVAIAPESAIELLNKGYDLDLKVGDLTNWELATYIIKRLSIVE